MNEPLSPERIMQVGLGFWASKTLLSAVELGLFTELAKGPEDLKSLEGRLGLHPRSARDFLDALVALGFLHRENGAYSNAPDSAIFLDKKKPSYVGGMLEMANARLFGHWNHLTEALRTGKPQNESKEEGGIPTFQALYSHPTRLRGFLRAMSGVSRGANLAIAAKFPWKDYKTVADLGAAQGDTLVQILHANSHLTGVGFDLPPVAPIFEEYIEEHKLSKRLTFKPGSFFEDPIPTADVLVMGHILHDWDLQQKKFLLAKACKALPTGGALVVYDTLIDDERSRNAFGLLMSLNMLIETDGGFDYTGADCQAWMKEAGFSRTRVEHLAGPSFMIVGIK